MSPFIDGPAAGEELTITRPQLLLRVTQNGITFRCLDQLSDEPEETEIIYVYQRISDRNSTCQYSFIQPQPKEYFLRETHSWRGWASRRIPPKPARA